MTTKLADLPSRCFHGVIPSVIATSAPDGTPNVSYLSSIEPLAGDQLAVSCQFFNKTKQNVCVSPYACVEVYDPISFEAYRLELRYHHEECSGPLFERMRLRIEAIASHVGMKGVFRLRSADVFDVLSIERREGYLDGTELPLPARAPDPRPRTEIRALQIVSGRVRQASDLDSLLRELFAALEDELGFGHAMVLVPDETGGRLVVIGTHGYEADTVGGEVQLGDGLIGTVARERRVVRVTGVGADLRYQRAIRAGLQRSAPRHQLALEIPLPGLPDAQSQLAIPLVAGDRLLGVLAVESRERVAFEEWHETFLEIVGNQVAATMDAVVRREREDAAVEPAPPEAAPEPERCEDHASCPARRFRFFPGDDCLFVEDEYLIRNVPARILWYVLGAHVASGRVDFTNRELRVQPSLGLPEYRDNLESRLVLLRRRLAEKCPALRLTPTGRGRFRLESDVRILLEEEPA